jgi:hypothetical protein
MRGEFCKRELLHESIWLLKPGYEVVYFYYTITD